MLGIWKLCAPTPFDTAVCRFWRDCKGQAFGDAADRVHHRQRHTRTGVCRALLPCAVGRGNRARAHRRIGQCCGILAAVSHDRSSSTSRAGTCSARRPLGRDLTIVQRLLFLPTHWLFPVSCRGQDRRTISIPIDRRITQIDGSVILPAEAGEKTPRGRGRCEHSGESPGERARLKPRGASPHIKESPA